VRFMLIFPCLLALVLSAGLSAQSGEAADPASESLDGPPNLEATKPAPPHKGFPDAAAEGSKTVRKTDDAVGNLDEGMERVEQPKPTPVVNLEDQTFPEVLPGESAASTTLLSEANEPTSYLPDVINVVLGILLISLVGGGLLWLGKRSPKMKRYFGGGPIKVLSRAYLGPKYAVILVKIGERVLVVGQGPDGLSTLSEITSRDEVMRLMADVEAEQPDSASQTFASVLREAGHARDLPKSAKAKSAVHPSSAAPAPSAGANGSGERKVDVARKGVLDLVEDSDVRVGAEGQGNSKARLEAIREQLEEQKARLEQ